MNNNNQPITRNTRVKNELGMHARPASRIAQMAESATGDVWLEVDGHRVDAGSIIDILAMCAVKDTAIGVTVAAEADLPVLEKIVDFFESGFGEM